MGGGDPEWGTRPVQGLGLGFSMTRFRHVAELLSGSRSGRESGASGWGLAAKLGGGGGGQPHAQMLLMEFSRCVLTSSLTETSPRTLCSAGECSFTGRP